MLIEAIKPENLAHFSELIPRHDFCVLPLQICKVKCDWFVRAGVTEIVLVAQFWLETSDSRNYVCVHRLLNVKLFFEFFVMRACKGQSLMLEAVSGPLGT